jgi:hypothetical protein
MKRGLQVTGTGHAGGVRLGASGPPGRGGEPARLPPPAGNFQARPADQDLVLRALTSVARAGPYFTLDVGDDGQRWCPAAEMYRDGLRGWITTTSAQLGVTEARVAASTVQLGFAARLWSPVLGCSLLHGIVPDLRDLRIATSPPLRLNVPEPRGWQSADQEELAALAYHMVVAGHLEPLGGSLPVKVAAGLLRGNAAAAMTAALRVLAHAHPGVERPARALAQTLLATGLLHRTGDFTGPGLEFRRRSCCLYYRIPGGGTCSDCPLPGR